MPRLISDATANQLGELLRAPPARASGASGALSQSCFLVECGTLISSSPQAHYNGTVQWAGSLSGPSDATGAADGVILADLDAGTLTPGSVYIAYLSGTASDGRPILWCRQGATGTVTGTGTDNRVARWNGTTAIQDSGATLSDTHILSLPYVGQFQIAVGAGSYGAAIYGPISMSYPAAEAGVYQGMWSNDASETQATMVLLDPLNERVVINSASSSSPKLSISNGTAFVDGVTGTLGPGAAATGGIITTLGTGSFVGTASANTFTNTNTFPNTGLVVKDTDDSHGLTVAPGSNLSADRTFTLATGDANRTLDISAGNVTITAAGNSLTSAANAGAQRTVLSLGTADSPTFAGATFSGAVGVTGTLTATTFSGSGASLTALPSSQLTGALPAISGTALTSLSSSALTGALPAISGASLTSLNASNLASGLVAVARGGTGTGSTPTNGQLLIGNGTNYTLATLTAGTGVSVTNGSGTITIASTVTGTVPRGHIDGLTLAYNSTTLLSIAAGQCADSTGAKLLELSALTKTLQSSGSWTAGTGNNGLDTGARAANTWYHVFVIADSTGATVDVLFSTSATSPTMPSGYALFRRVGSVYTTASALLSDWWRQCGDTFLWTSPKDDVSALNPGTSAVTRTLSTPLGVRTRALLSAGFDANATGDNPAAVYLSDLSQTDAAAGLTTTTCINYSPSAYIANMSVPAEIWTNTSSQIRSRIQLSATNTRLRIQTHGWIDARGKDGL